MPSCPIDLGAYPRRAHFEYFSSMANPYVGATVMVDITDFDARRRALGFPFFLSLLYCVGRAANAVPELRQRILDGGIIEFDRCETSHTAARPDGTYGYCRLDCGGAFGDFLPRAQAAHAAAVAGDSLDEEGDVLPLIFISTLPWLRYTSISQPTPIPADSNPRITWGKYAYEGGRLTLPMTLLANHALVDGLHIARFFEALDAELSRWQSD